MIKDFFEKRNWKYAYFDTKNIFYTKLDMENILGTLDIFITIGTNNYYNVYTILNSNAEEKYYAQVAEFLHRANHGLIVGNFEMDYNNGEIRFKTYVNFDGTDLSPEIINESIYIGASMFDRYGKELVKVMIGKGNPKECVEQAEAKSTSE